MDALSTAVILVNWNSTDDTRQCLRSLERCRAEWTDCVVVDNASQGGPPEELRRDFPWVRLVEAPANLGYAGGNNLGMKIALSAGVEHVFLLNNDTTVAEGAIGALREAVLADSSVAIAGPVVYHAERAEKFWHGGGRLTRRPYRVRDDSDPSIVEAAAPVAADYIPGCALFLRRSVVTEIGPLDERFFLTWEDTDWAMRAAGRGKRSVVVPRAKIWHAGSQSFDGRFSLSPLYSYYFFRNMLLFARLHFPIPDRPTAYRDTAGYARAIYRRCPKDGTQRRFAAAVALGFLHFIAGRYGAAPPFLTARALRIRREQEC